jgi:hypothetical protein
MKKDKSRYTKPEISRYQLDNNISLQMTSWNEPPPDPPRSISSENAAANSQSSPNPFETNPFGE